MNYVVMGLNHRTASVDVRERLAMVPSALAGMLKHLAGLPGVHETAVLSTCNRFELYGVVQPQAPWREMFGEAVPISLDALYTRENRDAVNHLFTVTSSLDSMVLGENEIARQVKDAHTIAKQENTVGPYLNKLFHRALHVAKRVKTETAVGQGQVSVGSVAVSLARRIFGDLSDKSVVLLGAGEVGKLVWQHVVHFCNPEKVVVINRNQERADGLVDGASRTASFTELDVELEKADIVISALSGEIDGLSGGYFSQLMLRRRQAPLFLIDLGVPRNIDPKVGDLKDIFLYNIDDLNQVSSDNHDSRLVEARRAQDIVTEETNLFLSTFVQAEFVPTIVSLNQKFETIRSRELEKSLAKLKHLGEEDRQVVDRLTRSIVNKALHDPILVLRNGKDLSGGGLIQMVRQIFRLGDGEENEYQ